VAVPVRVLIADDHSVVRQGLRMFLKLDPELEVVGEASNGAEAIQMARALTPDVVLMDLLMPGTDGITATQRIRAEVPKTEVLALTSVLEDASVVGAVQAGAVGYLLKDTQANSSARRSRQPPGARCSWPRRRPHGWCARSARRTAPSRSPGGRPTCCAHWPPD